MKRLALSALLLLFAVPALAATHTAVDCENTPSLHHVQDAVDAISADDDVVVIPAGTCTWTQTLNFDTHSFKGIWFHGAGIESARGGSGNTVIHDGVSGSALITFTLNGNDTFTHHFRMYGITFDGGGVSGDKFPIDVFGGSHFCLFDHFTADMNGYAAGARAAFRVLGDEQWCVFSEYVFTASNGDFNFVSVGGSGEGDAAWAADTNFGGPNFVFVENGDMHADDFGGHAHGVADDTHHGGRIVVRSNNLCAGVTTGCVGIQTHPTGGSGPRERGGRALESYLNTGAGSFDNTQFNMHFISSGAALMWGNTPTEGFEHFVTLHADIRNSMVYGEIAPPHGWGFCGPQPGTGTVNIHDNGDNTATVTLVSGTNFSTSWPIEMMYRFDGTMFLFQDQTAANPWDGWRYYHVMSVTDTTHIVIDTTFHNDNEHISNPGNQSGRPYYVGSYANGNADDYGYRCLDQPGSGKGDLITGLRPSDGGSGGTLVKNTATGKFSDEPGFYPRQQLDPVYEWKNVPFNCTGCDHGFAIPYEPGVLKENVTYFLHAGDGTVNTSCPTPNTCTPFNGSVGTGHGPRSLRPSVGMADHVAYWAEDAGGNWNTMPGNTDMNDGCLDVYHDGSWHDCDYTPYPLPHPLVSGTPPAASIVSLTPADGNVGDSGLSIAVVGFATNFVNATTVCNFGSNVTINSCTVSDATHLTANITIGSMATTGLRDATFTTGGEVATRSNGFDIHNATITSLTPSSGAQGAVSLSIAVVGSSTHFVNGTTTCDFGPSITINTCIVSDSTHLTTTITISALATLGSRDVTFSTSGELARLNSGFNVTGASSIKFNPRQLRN